MAGVVILLVGIIVGAVGMLSPLGLLLLVLLVNRLYFGWRHEVEILLADLYFHQHDPPHLLQSGLSERAGVALVHVFIIELEAK